MHTSGRSIPGVLFAAKTTAHLRTTLIRIKFQFEPLPLKALRKTVGKVRPSRLRVINRMEQQWTSTICLLSEARGREKRKIPSLQKPRQIGSQNWLGEAENLSTAALHKIIVKSKFQPPINVNKVTSQGVAQPDIHKMCNWPFKTTKDTKLIMSNSR